MDYEEALIAKYESGKKKHRKKDAKWEGDPVEELYEELLDAYHYVLVLENAGVDLPGYRTTFRNMALNLKSRNRELTRRI